MDQPTGQDTSYNYSHPFHAELFHLPIDKTDNSENIKAQLAESKSIMPELLDTDKPLSKCVVHQILNNVAEHFDKLVKAMNLTEKDPLRLNDNQNKQQCPFMKVANAVGFKYSPSDKATPDESGKTQLS